MQDTYSVIGLMSGSSLDGLDIAHCSFTKNEKWLFKIIGCKTIPFPPEINKILSDHDHPGSPSIIHADIEFGRWMGHQLLDFLKDDPNIDLIASHGHTLFHEPEAGITIQLGNGEELHKITGKPVVYDFRKQDIMLGGQGAPLAPTGDEMLFWDYDICLNLGGIANLSFNHLGNRIAWDVCVLNQVLNYFAVKLGYKYDKDGELAKHGKPDQILTERLGQLEFYRKAPPKSLNNQFSSNHILPFFYEGHYENNLATYTHHIAKRIAFEINKISKLIGDKPIKVLVTGGGAFNNYLIDLIRINLQNHIQLHIPEKDIVNFKEALVFAFLGVLRARNEINVMKSVTGARADTSSGTMIGELQK